MIPHPFQRSARFAAVAALAMVAGCATITESTEQQVVVQTVLDNREVAGVGCILYNDVGKWFVTTPARITVKKSAGPMRIDCRTDGADWAYEKFSSKENGSLWGNVVMTAGVGIFVDKNTGAGFDYPSTLTVMLHKGHPDDDHPPLAPGVTVY